MAKKWAESFYKSNAWRRCRGAYIAERIAIDGGVCEVCREQPGYIVHHIKPLTPKNINNPDIALSFSNLRYDCKECHDREEVHAFVTHKKGRCVFDSSGQPYLPDE